MPLPLVDQIREARRRMNEAAEAHRVVHEISYCLSLPAPEAEPVGPLPGEELSPWLAERWPELRDLAEPLPAQGRVEAHRERLRRAQEALAPLAAEQHALEHALEGLLFGQWQALQEEPEHLALRERLTPLYDERQVLFEKLVPALHQQALIPAAAELIETYTGPLASELAAGEGGDPLALTRAAFWADAATQTLRDTLPQLGVEVSVPDAPPEGAPLAVLAGYAEALSGALAAVRDLQRGLADAIARDRARWDDIVRQIEEHTG